MRGCCKHKLGASAFLIVSLALCKTGADVFNICMYKCITDLASSRNLALTVSFFNVIIGGSQVGHTLAMPVFMAHYVRASFKEAMKMNVEVYY